MKVVNDIWDGIHRWMENNSPEMLKLLNKGVTEEQLIKLERNLGVNHLPEDFKASYLRHNGSKSNVFFASMKTNSFLEIREIVEEWGITKLEYDDLDDRSYERCDVHPKEIKTVQWSESWIPFGDDSNGNFICIDLDPTSFGTYGQVIQWFNDQQYTALQAKSFTEYLMSFLQDLESGRYSLAEDHKSLILSDSFDSNSETIF